MIKNLAVAAAFAAGALVTAVPAAASPLTDCVARHGTSSSADYCASLYGPTKTVTQTKTSTVTSTKREVEFIPVEAEVDPADFAILVALLAAAVAVGAGGTLIWTRTRAQKPAHAGWTAPPPADAHAQQQHAQAAPNAHAHPQQQYAPPPTYNAPTAATAEQGSGSPAAHANTDDDPFGL